MKLTSDVKQRKQRSQHNNPNPNNSYKTKFTGSYTEVNPNYLPLKGALSRYLATKKLGADYLNEVYVNHCLELSCGLDVVSINNG